jgi:hypothetical protein
MEIVLGKITIMMFNDKKKKICIVNDINAVYVMHIYIYMQKIVYIVFHTVTMTYYNMRLWRKHFLYSQHSFTGCNNYCSITIIIIIIITNELYFFRW